MESLIISESQLITDAQIKWDYRFLDLAKLVSEWSKDVSTQVGAAIIDKDRRIVSTGYNGFPTGVSDDLELYLNRDEKLKRMVHAECNAIIFSKRDLMGCTLYTYPFQPCSNCSGQIINAGIKRVVSFRTNTERWKHSFEISARNFKEAGVTLDLY